MPTLELSSEELSLLRECIALVLGGVFQDEAAAPRISNILRNKTEDLEALYSKLEHPRPKKRAK
jgi:hypothetical protein